MEESYRFEFDSLCMTEFLESDNGCFLYGGVFATTNDVERLLFAAVILRDLETVAELMRTTNGVTIDLNSRDDEGHTCLGIACKSGHLPTIKLLLQNGADINRSDFYGLTPLQYATEYGQVDTVRLLINEGADVNYIEERLSALHIAAGKGHIDITKLLIQAKCNVNILTRKGIAPLHYAVANGHREVIKLLLAASASVNVKGYKERTPIYMAGEAGDVELARVLIRVGAKLNTKDYYEMTPLNVVCNRNNTEVAKLFINQGSRVNVPDRTGSLPIHYVARNGNTEVLQLLLEAGSEVDRLNNHSESPLHLAVRMHHVDIVRKLVEVGCSANNYDPENPVAVSPLYAAVSVYTDPAEFEVVLGLLISAHCSLNAHIESTSATPLYRALDLGKVGIASVLLRHGADPYVTCPHDTTILSKACQRDMTSIAEMIVTSTHRWRSEPWLASSFNTTCLSSRNLGRFGEVPEDVPMVFWHKQTFYRRIQEIMTNVMPLMGCCRLVIRESLSDRLQEKINQLFLPNSLKGYLMMK